MLSRPKETTGRKRRAICSIEFAFEIETTGLLGGKWEFDPYASIYTSFGRYRVHGERDVLKLRDDGSIKQQTKTLQPRPKQEKKPDEKDKEEKEIKEIIVERVTQFYESTVNYNYELDDYEKMRGCDAIKFKLFCKTSFSGVPYLDATESGYVKREVSEGLCHIELVDLFQMYFQHLKRGGDPNGGFTIEDEFIDEKIVKHKISALAKTDNITVSQYNKLLPLARELTVKAKIKIFVVLKNFNMAYYKESIYNKSGDLKKNGLFAHLESYEKKLSSTYNANNKSTLPLTREQSIGDILTKRKPLPPHRYPEFQCMLYNSQRNWETMNNVMTTTIINQICDCFIKMNEKHQPRYSPSEHHISNLQLVLYDSENGPQPVYGYWSNHEPFFRQYATLKAKRRALKMYPLRKKSEDHLLLMLKTSLRMSGLSMKRFCQAIKNHFSRDNKSLDIEPDFIRAEEIIVKIGTFAAVQNYYTADYRLMNEETTVNATANASKAAPACKGCGKKMRVRVLNLDSWDNGIMNGTMMCDDCEGMGNVVSSILRQFLIGRYDLDHTWEYEAIQLIMLFFKYTNIFSNGALVTSAFMNTDNKKVELQQNETLPRIGSPMDLNARHDGHCFDITQSQVQTIKMLKAGNGSKELIDEMEAATYISDESAIRENQRQVLVLEPTGSIDPRILSVEESYKKYPILFRKKKAEVLYMRKMRAIIKSDQKKYDNIMGLFNGEGMANSIKQQPNDIMVSSFYHAIVHATCVDLFQRFGDVTLAQFAICKNVKGKPSYGVRMGELIRHNDSTGLSLIGPFAGQQKEWEANVFPMVETIQNQMPIEKFGRYSDREYAEEIYSLFIDLDEVDMKFLFTEVTVAKRKNSMNGKFRRRETEFQAKIDSLDDQNETVVKLYSRSWKLDKCLEDRADLLEYLQSLPGLKDIAIYIEKHIPNAEPVIVFLLIIDVNVALKFE